MLKRKRYVTANNYLLIPQTGLNININFILKEHLIDLIKHDYDSFVLGLSQFLILSQQPQKQDSSQKWS